MPDKLDTIISHQAALQEALGYDLKGMCVRDRANYIMKYTQHTEHELHEMLQELPYFKEWKRYDKTWDEFQEMFAAAKKEFADALHFFINIAIVLGFTPEELLQAYLDKNAINYDRQAQPEYKRCVDDSTGK